MRSFPMPVTASTSPTTASDLRDFIMTFGTSSAFITTFSSLYDDDGRTYLVWVELCAASWVRTIVPQRAPPAL